MSRTLPLAHQALVAAIQRDTPGTDLPRFVSVLDALIAVQHRHRQQDRAGAVDGQEGGGGIRGRRQDDRDPVAGFDAVGREQVGDLGAAVLQLAPRDLRDGARTPAVGTLS